MAKWKDNKANNDNKQQENGAKRKDEQGESKKAKYESIRVPAADLASMEFGTAKFVVSGGNQLVDVVGVHLIKQPVQRTIDIVVAEVMVTEGHMKGSTAFWPYPAGADVVIQKTETHIKAEKKQKRTDMWNKFLNTISFGLV